MADTTQRDIAEKAEKLKKEGAKPSEWLERQVDTSGEGMSEHTADEHAARGSLDAEGHRPVLERSRKER